MFATECSGRRTRADGNALKPPEPPGERRGEHGQRAVRIPQHQPLREPTLAVGPGSCSLHDRGNVYYRYYILDTLTWGRTCPHGLCAAAAWRIDPRRRDVDRHHEPWLRHVEAKTARVPTSTSSGTCESDVLPRLGRWVLAREETWRTSAMKVGWGFTATKPSSTTTSNRPRAGPTCVDEWSR